MSDQLISQLFSLEGPLAAIAPGFRVRPSQIELAQMVERTIAERSTLVAEAGTGTGKTWLACALGNQACRLGTHTIYRTATKLFEDISLSYADHTIPKLRRQLIRAELLIIDDLGIGGIDAQLGPFLLEVIDQQSQSGSLLITSQYPQDKWYDLFADPTIADAILDRIVHKSHTIVLKGESMRRIKSRKRT